MVMPKTAGTRETRVAAATKNLMASAKGDRKATRVVVVVNRQKWASSLHNRWFSAHFKLRLIFRRTPEKAQGF